VKIQDYTYRSDLSFYMFAGDGDRCGTARFRDLIVWVPHWDISGQV
jgi:hypothetical protein